jgi:adenylate cyclase
MTTNRKLAAVFAADIAGYSALMSADEEGTVRRLKALQDAVLPILEAHGGRVIDLAGDGILAEFSSAVRAVESAISAQRCIEALNGPSEPPMLFRIGINIGDVVHDDQRLYGDGINIAARLEAIAEPGGICISQKVHEEVFGKVECTFRDIGNQSLKNIPKPVHAFAISPARSRSAGGSPVRAAPRAHSDKPSIVVLPFINMSGDPDQEYFVDGITEDLIMELSRFRSLFVIARNSSFFYKGRSVRAQDIAGELGVRYVAEGSVRKAGNRVRITAELVDAASGSQVWAQRFDRDLEDVFAVQNEVVQSIVAILERRLEAADLERVNRTEPKSWVAYDYVLRAKHHHHRVTKDDNAQALAMAETAVTLDPSYAQAHAWVACSLGQAMTRGYKPWSDNDLRRSFEAAELARSLDDNDAECHRILCEINLIRREYDRAQYHQERALSLNPNDPRIMAQRGYLLTWLGQASEGVKWIEQALRLDPAQSDEYHVRALVVLHAAHRYADALHAFSRISRPQYSAHAHVAACFAELGETTKAQGHAAKVLGLEPGFSAKKYSETLHFKHEADREHIRSGMLKAGLAK